jgi:flagellar protein FlgJ
MEIQGPGNAAATPQQAEAAPDRRMAEAKKVAREFEAVFLTQVVDEMMRTVNVGSFGGGHAEETWRSFLARAFADEIASSGSFGVAQSVERMVATYYGASIKETDT